LCFGALDFGLWNLEVREKNLKNINQSGHRQTRCYVVSCIVHPWYVSCTFDEICDDRSALFKKKEERSSILTGDG
jgi:hypothetical protein